MLQTASVISLLVLAVIVFLLLSYTLIVGRQVDRLEAATQKQKDVIGSLRPVETKHVLLKQKLSFAEKIISEPSIPYEVALDFFVIAHQESSVLGMDTGKETPGIVLGGSVPDVGSLVVFLDRLVAFSKEHSAIRLIGEGFNRTPEGEYQYTVLLEPASQ